MSAPARLVVDYRPSQPHGWPGGGPDQPVGATIGGHTAAAEFVHNSHTYRLELLTLDAADDPAYAPIPADPTLDFSGTVSAACGERFAFRYAGGLRGRGQFRVQSYAVTVSERLGLVYGADLYVEYTGAAEPGSVLRFIQVFNSPAVTGGDASVLDNRRRVNPYALNGGPTSINGRRLVNFYNGMLAPAMEDASDLSDRYVAEVFLASDTGRRDRTGRAVVDVLGGIRYGWQIRMVTT